jgi:hypothetical protein
MAPPLFTMKVIGTLGKRVNGRSVEEALGRANCKPHSQWSLDFASQFCCPEFVNILLSFARLAFGVLPIFTLWPEPKNSRCHMSIS